MLGEFVPATREAKPGDFIDKNLLKKLEQNGWFDTLGR
jgi:hypothetical protein